MYYQLGEYQLAFNSNKYLATTIYPCPVSEGPKGKPLRSGTFFISMFSVSSSSSRDLLKVPTYDGGQTSTVVQSLVCGGFFRDLKTYNRMGPVIRLCAGLTHTHLFSLAEEVQQSFVFLTHPVFQTVHRLDQLMSLQNCDSLMWLQFIRFPLDNQQLHMIKANFMACRYAGVVGAVDGTHIQIIAPSKDEDVFVNRKKVHSINTQIAFDATFNILDVAKWPAGSTHDPRILIGSGLRREAPCTSWVSCWVTGCPCKTSDTSQSTTGSTVKWARFHRDRSEQPITALTASKLVHENRLRFGSTSVPYLLPVIQFTRLLPNPACLTTRLLLNPVAEPRLPDYPPVAEPRCRPSPGSRLPLLPCPSPGSQPRLAQPCHLLQPDPLPCVLRLISRLIFKLKCDLRDQKVSLFYCLQAMVNVKDGWVLCKAAKARMVSVKLGEGPKCRAGVRDQKDQGEVVRSELGTDQMGRVHSDYQAMSSSNKHLGSCTEITAMPLACKAQRPGSVGVRLILPPPAGSSSCWLLHLLAPLLQAPRLICVSFTDLKNPVGFGRGLVPQATSELRKSQQEGLKTGPTSGAGHHRDLLGSKGLEGHPVTAASETLSTQHLGPGVKSLWVIRIRLILFNLHHLPVVLGQREMSGTGPYLGANPFQGALPFTEKRELFPGLPRLLRGRLRYRTGRLAAPISASPNSGI
ncbi:putative nuclease HARBI1 [Merluccius polli]|uniref:Nuclease HARBI1 n=1 Tax=Merluccius polli TaxID=89951 RepID=A0AA47PCB1_MERPO|nr:putative nuclease HARBI1 [Merluccius polli]